MSDLRLKEILEEKGISQRKLSIEAGIASQDVNQAINGKKPFFLVGERESQML